MNGGSGVSLYDPYAKTCARLTLPDGREMRLNAGTYRFEGELHG